MLLLTKDFSVPPPPPNNSPNDDTFFLEEDSTVLLLLSEAFRGVCFVDDEVLSIDPKILKVGDLFAAVSDGTDLAAFGGGFAG